MRFVRGVRPLALALALLPGATPARALDLPSALAQVASANPALSAQAARVDAASARVRSAGGWSAPMLEVGVQNLPTTFRFDEDMMTMTMVGLEQRIPISGANGLRRDAAREGVSAARAALAQSRNERLGAAWEAYSDAFYAGDLALDTEAHDGLMDRIVAAARARYTSGQGRLDDLLAAEAERARMRADAAMFRGEEAAARVRLDALRGRTPGGTPEPLAEPPLPELDPDPRAWLADSTHPRLAEPEASARQYHTAAAAARRARWPDLDLRVSYGFRGTVQGVPMDDLMSASVGVMLPVFSGGREGADADEYEALARMSEADRREASLELAESVGAAHAIAQAGERQVTLLADTVLVAARKAVDAAWSSYQAGGADLARVLDMSHGLYQQDVALHRARQSLAHAHARLVALTGRTDLLGVAPPPGLGSESGGGR
jgi:outer membrane protein TolC